MSTQQRLNLGSTSKGSTLYMQVMDLSELLTVSPQEAVREAITNYWRKWEKDIKTMRSSDAKIKTGL